MFGGHFGNKKLYGSNKKPENDCTMGSPWHLFYRWVPGCRPIGSRGSEMALFWHTLMHVHANSEIIGGGILKWIKHKGLHRTYSSYFNGLLISFTILSRLAFILIELSLMDYQQIIRLHVNTANVFVQYKKTQRLRDKTLKPDVVAIFLLSS